MSKRSRRLLAYRPRSGVAHPGLGLRSIEAWPAAGGGLLVGIAEPDLAGAAPLRPAVKTVFIRIDDRDTAGITLPYVTLEDDVRGCIRTLVAKELCIPGHQLEIRAAEPAGLHGIADLGPIAERSLQACAAVARTLLIVAAAESWGLSADLCRISEGAVVGPDRTASCGAVAADAALCDLPSSVRLVCGRDVPLLPPTPDPGGGLSSAY